MHAFDESGFTEEKSVPAEKLTKHVLAWFSYCAISVQLEAWEKFLNVDNKPDNFSLHKVIEVKKIKR